MNVLVTGNKGRLGTLVTTQLRKQHTRVIKFDRGDDVKDLESLDIDYIIHLASKLPDDNVEFEEYLTDNVKLTNEMLKLAQKKKCEILITQTYAMFFRLDHYSISKAIVDSLISEYRDKVKIRVIRLPYIKYEDNIFSKIKQKLETEKTLIDDVEFPYVEATTVVKQICNEALGFNTYNIIPISKCNLYNKFKNNENTIKGEPKSFEVIGYNKEIILKYENV